MRRILSTLVLLPVLLLPGGVRADGALDLPPGAHKNVELVGNVGNLPADHPETLRRATAINFLQYGRRDVMFVVGRFGLRSYDLANPTRPRLLDSVTNPMLAQPGDDLTGTFWQNEDMSVDPRRKLVLLARDPRAFNGSTGNDASVSGIYVIDARDPADLRLLTFHPLPAGHTSTCINGCDFLWTGGPAPNAGQQARGWTGRPIFVTDLRDPRHPITFPEPVDVARDDGTTSYSHDVQVDALGIAWVSGRGGVRGYWTQGIRWDPVERRLRRATPLRPVPYAGGGTDESLAPARGRSRFMHNAERPVGARALDGAAPGGRQRPGSLLYATEEEFVTGQCVGDGAFIIASLEGSFGGQAWRSTPERKFRLRTVGSWSVADKEGSGPTEDCSAHYFQLGEGVAAYAWYGQGTRFLDVRDPANPIQIAYYRPDDTTAWAPYWHRGLVYVADHGRGVDILRLTAGARRASLTRSEVLAPPLAAADTVAALKRVGFRPDALLGWACRVPVPA